MAAHRESRGDRKSGDWEKSKKRQMRVSCNFVSYVYSISAHIVLLFFMKIKAHDIIKCQVQCLVICVGQDLWLWRQKATIEEQHS